jgi:energy-coupling factor transporter ATP-binding protein EcfA2
MGARAEIYKTIAALAQEGMAVIVVSSDLEEVLGLSHRVLVLARGRQKGILERADASNVKIGESNGDLALLANIGGTNSGNVFLAMLRQISRREFSPPVK